MNAIKAFFDLDGTIIQIKSMFSFLTFLLTKSSLIEPMVGEAKLVDYRLALKKLHGQPRETINQHYYRQLKGFTWDELQTASIGWWEILKNEPQLWNELAIQHLKTHQDRGHEVILVTGSFSPCIDPIKKRLGITRSLHTQLASENNLLNGEIDGPVMIGEGKAQAIRDLINQMSDCQLSDCYAYGDHHSDIPMLGAVGHPVAINSDPILTKHAEAKGWSICY